MPPGIQANNMSPMGFGQPNMARAATPGPGYGMPARPVAPGQEPQPSAPPGGTGKPNPFMASGIPALYASPMGQAAMRAKPSAFPAEAVYNRVQQAILNPGPPNPPPPVAPPPMMEPQMPMGPLPMGGQMPGPMGPQGGTDMASAMAWMQQQLGGQQ